MNRADYIEILQDRLKGLPTNEIEEAIRYVEEYFDEAGEENFHRAMDELGSPYRFANQVKANIISKNDYSYRSSGAERTSSRNNSTNIWILILGILSLPISVPLLIAVVAMAFSLVVMILAFIVAGGAVLVAGVVSIFYGFSNFNISVNGALSMVAVSLLMIGIGLVLVYFFAWLLQIVLPKISAWLGNLYQKIKERVK